MLQLQNLLKETLHKFNRVIDLIGGVLHPLFLYAKNKKCCFYYFSMHVLNTSNSTQVLKVIPRRQNNGVVTMTLIDKSTSRESNYVSEYYWHTTDFYFNELDVDWNQDPDFVFAYADVFSTITSIFYLKEGTFYTIKLSDIDGELYEGMIFCTDQTDYDKYDPNKNDYVVESTYDNEYVIL